MPGDPGQLPSVQAGAFLRDLVDTKVAHISTLTKSFRMNKSDLQAAGFTKLEVGSK